MITVTVGPESELFKTTLIAGDFNWISVPELTAPMRVKAKAQPVHHTAPAAPVHRLRNTRRPISQLLQDQIDKLGREEQ